MRRFFLFLAVLCVFSVRPQYMAFAQIDIDYMTINDVLENVSRNNPSLGAAREELRETQELYPQARAGWLPSMTAEASVFSTEVESSNFGSGDGATTKDLTLNLDQPIFRGGRTFSEVSRAQNLIKAGEFLFKKTEQDLYLKAVIAYMDLLRDIEIYGFRKENEGILQEEFQAAQERYDLGESTVTDVHQAKVRYQRATSETINALSLVETSKAEFLEVAGIIPGWLVKPDAQFDFPADLEEMIVLAEQQNPEIWRAQYEHLAAENNADAVLRELFPQVSAFASYNKQYDPQPGIVDEAETQTIGLRTTLALYQGGATRSREREARRSVKKRQFEIDEIKRRIRQEITSDWRSYQAAIDETRSRMDEIKAAELALKGVREEMRMGARAILDVLDADQEVIDAKIAMARASRNEVVRRFALAASLGMLGPENEQTPAHDERDENPL